MIFRRPLRAAFDPDSGLDHAGKGHYPQCLVSTVQDVFRRLPIARTVRPIADANEREELKALLPFIPAGASCSAIGAIPATI